MKVLAHLSAHGSGRGKRRPAWRRAQDTRNRSLMLDKLGDQPSFGEFWPLIRRT